MAIFPIDAKGSVQIKESNSVVRNTVPLVGITEDEENEEINKDA